VLPATARPHDTLDIWGHSLVLGQPSAKERTPQMSIGATKIKDISIVDDTLSGLDHLRCTLPTETAIGPGTLRIVTRAGVSTEIPLEVIEVKPPVPGRGSAPELLQGPPE
jgi:hypothetical protein